MLGAVVIVKVKKKLIFHSKLQKFETEEDRDEFFKRITKWFVQEGYKFTDIQKFTVSDTPIPSEGEPIRGKYYCPYCGTHNKLKQGEFGSRICPICGISEQDFYFKKYNNIK